VSFRAPDVLASGAPRLGWTGAIQQIEKLAIRQRLPCVGNGSDPPPFGAALKGEPTHSELRFYGNPRLALLTAVSVDTIAALLRA
jgi:hypothetical protein